MSRKSILLLLAGVLSLGAGVAVIVQHRGERQLAQAMERFETEIGTLDVAAHVPGELPEEENAAFFLKRGATALEALSEAERLALNELWEREGDPGPDVEALLECQAAALDDLRRAGELRASSWGIQYDIGFEAPQPDLLPHLWSKKVLAADARSALAAGDRERLLADAQALVSLRRSLEREPMLVAQMIALSVELAYHELLQQVLLSDLGDVGTLERLAADLDASAAGRSMRATLSVEAARSIHYFNELIAGDRSFWQGLKSLPLRVWVPTEYASGVDFYYHLAKTTEMTGAEGERYLNSNPTSTPGMRIMAQIMVPHLREILQRDRVAAAVRGQAGLAVAARLQALEDGAYPADLRSLAGESKTDPYSGVALQYQRLADGSAELSSPDSEKRWQAQNPNSPHYAPRFHWRLPKP